MTPEPLTEERLNEIDERLKKGISHVAKWLDATRFYRDKHLLSEIELAFEPLLGEYAREVSHLSDEVARQREEIERLRKSVSDTSKLLASMTRFEPPTAEQIPELVKQLMGARDFCWSQYQDSESEASRLRAALEKVIKTPPPMGPTMHNIAREALRSSAGVAGDETCNPQPATEPAALPEEVRQIFDKRLHEVSKWGDETASRERVRELHSIQSLLTPAIAAIQQRLEVAERKIETTLHNLREYGIKGDDPYGGVFALGLLKLAAESEAAALREKLEAIERDCKDEIKSIDQVHSSLARGMRVAFERVLHRLLSKDRPIRRERDEAERRAERAEDELSQIRGALNNTNWRIETRLVMARQLISKALAAHDKPEPAEASQGASSRLEVKTSPDSSGTSASSTSLDSSPPGPSAPMRYGEVWRPIAEAPRDGSEVLVMFEGYRDPRPRMAVAHYMPGGHCIEDHPPIDEGWYFDRGAMFGKGSNVLAWMPLPTWQGTG